MRPRRSCGAWTSRTNRFPAVSDGPAVTSYEVDEHGVAVLRLQRPASRNAIDTQMLLELLEHLAVARGDEAVRVLVISSADHMGLSAGAHAKGGDGEEGQVRGLQLFSIVYDQIVAFP